MDTIAKLVALTILYFFFSTIVPGQITAPKDLSSSEFRAENISGGWRLNETESDELLETLESLFQKVNVKISNKSVGETEGLISPPITFSLNAPKLLVITTGSDNNSITISEGLKKSISTRTFT
ncbi:MAG: hypothetical protein HKN25_10425, partial [Pyrinomonadaceae bacterium]|nr:hypothetical protein [Pyrinomonadaceae bacterium]